MNFFISTILILLLTSCGFNSSDEPGDNPQVQRVDPLKPSTSPNEDFDGDLMTNKDELAVGRNPNIANIPNVRVRFLQNYKITVKYKALADGKEGEFVIDTKTHQDNPDFKYRVGEIFIRNESFNTAANIGKFSTHTWGDFNEHDLSWVSYPEADPRFYSDKVLTYKKYFNPDNYEITNISVNLENSAKLKGNDGFKEIKNLNINFYYYDYEKESFELIESKLVERHFQAGVNETFDVVLENVPLNLIAENYFKKGEFIISELGDYEIPEMELTYKKLLTSVRAKSIPVIYNTPLESEISYVGMNGVEASFTDVLNTLFGKKAVIEQNELKKINQFESNLPDFTYLSEIKEHDKKGKWFVFTNKLRQHYLDHKFLPSDIISLSYITGNILADQKAEKIFSYRASADSTDDMRVYPLGNVTPNSRIHIQVKPERLWGEKVKHWTDSIYSVRGPCSGNCIYREYRCNFKFNIFESLDQKLTFNTDLSSEASRIKLIINQDEFSLADLVKEKKADLYWINNNLHIDIKNILAIKEITEIEENVMALRFIPKKETTYNGVLLESWSGRDWYFCPGIAINVAGHNKWPLSVDSKEFGKWQHQANWSRVIRGERKSYTQNFSAGVIGIITNLFN